MRNRLLALPFAALLIGAAPPTGDTLADGQCLIALGQLGGSEDPATRSAAMTAVHFFLGRLDGRAHGADLATLLTQSAAAMKQDGLAATLKGCFETVEQRGKALQAAGDSLKKQAPPAQ